MSLPPIHRLATSIWTRHGIPLHIKLNYLTFKHMLQPSLTPYPISARLKAVEHMLSSPIVYKNQFCELRELAAGRNSMDNRQYFTVAPKTHQLQYIEIPNTDIPCAPATRLVNCTDTTVNKQTPDTILYMHGGAYVGGSVPSHAPFACHISQDAQSHMYFLDYHCAPEYALELIRHQAVHAYQYMINTLHVAPQNIIFAGDSAGGGLVLLTLQALQQQGLPLPRAAWAIAPWGDMSNTIDSRLRLAHLDKTLCHAFLVAAAELATGNSYAAKLGKIDLTAAQYSPLNGDFHHLPPLHLTVGTHECLYDDTVKIAAKARAQGVDVTLCEMAHCFHNFPLYHQLAPEAHSAYRQIIDWTKQQFANSRSASPPITSHHITNQSTPTTRCRSILSL